ncbi:dihydropyrimidinase [Anaerobacterium chartisolvens]|uniref:Dihydropyrimidinase n=1 Tax=Anaerobacterium chartisolvens TaxID=1297424 RepID=A0A369AKE4_9FIRM|nr:dihydropyrimidinase [Anaerobacterium chartisolvens]RCX09573.1 dihydropyrimidinase [Anaerobacterium chartisolvens]
MLDLIIKNGTVVTPWSSFKADIAVKDSVIEAVGAASLFGRAKREIDAEGMYVLPGIIDPHTHFESPFMGCKGALDFYSGSIAGAFGGVTTFIDFTNSRAGHSVMASIRERREEMSKSCIDYGVHAKFVEAERPVLDEIKSIVEYGCPSFKMFMTYKKEGVMIDDEGMLSVMAEAKKWGGLPGVHAENNAIAESNVEKFIEEGRLEWEYFAKSKPNLCEMEAVQRVVLYARYTGCPLYIFHLSTAEGLSVIKQAQSEGVKVFTETCPHYLTLTREKYKQKDGHLYVMSPPLRGEQDLEAMWRGLGDGSISIIGSDDCTYSIEEKEMFLERDAEGNVKQDFTKIANGVQGIEARLMLLLEEGVNKGRITLNKLCEITSYNPAKTFGLYPQKGIIQKGSDADLVIIDPDKVREISHETLHHKVNYSIYDGRSVKGWPVVTIHRGRVIVENGEFLGSRGDGRFMKRKIRL